mgnify:FL=1
MIAVCGSAHAVEADQGQNSAPIVGQNYGPAYFERFAPKTALDMVRQVPGFALNESDQKRGFGQGGENVLINGRRVSGKSNGAIDALARIPADAVVRIEIVDGATLSIPGLSGQVANIITRTSGLSGSWKLEPLFREGYEPIYRGNGSINGESGPLSYTLGISIDGKSTSEGGPERVTNASGQLIDLRQEHARDAETELRINASATYLGMQGDLLNLSFSGGIQDANEVEDSRRSGAGQVDRLRLFSSIGNEWNGELAGDYEFALGPGRLKLIGIERLGHGTLPGTVLQYYANGSPTTGSRFVSKYDSGESIARAEYSLGSSADGDWQVAVEGAYNFLEQASRLETLDMAGLFNTGQPFANARVEEKRAEAGLTYNRVLAQGLNLQASFGGEYSQLSQTGPGGLVREFVRPKGFALLAWTATPDLDFSFRIERKVGQLNFGDFLASVNLGDNTQQAGNAELVPDQSWVGEVEANGRFGAFGALKVKFVSQLIEDIIDQIPIGLDGEAPGNIDSAERYGLTLNGALNLGPFGLPGARFDLRADFAYSRVEDPLTHEDRRISRENISNLSLSFRHDIRGTDWAWGFVLPKELRGPNFRLDQRSIVHMTPGMAQAFVENKNILGMTGRLTVMNLFNSHQTVQREVYFARRDGALDFTEDRTRTFGRGLILTLSDSF